MYNETTYAEINLDNLENNIKEIKNLIGNTKIMAVLKADAYGHKATFIFDELIKLGVKYFAVANINEALELRRKNKICKILVLGNVPVNKIKLAIESNISLTIFSYEFWEVVKPFLNKKLDVHIKINTGFNRLGFDPTDENLNIVLDICNHENINAEGIFTHLALLDKQTDENQFNIFMDFIDKLSNKGISFKFRHIADSIAAVIYPFARLDMVRLGAVMYGLKAGHKQYDNINLKSTLKLYSSITQVRELKKGEGISYDLTFKAKENMKIGVVGFGYADGYPRSASNKGYVLINGKKAPIIGLMCMDQCIVDLTGHENIKLNDTVLVYDIDSDSEVSVNNLAILAGTNKNSIIASLGRRVTRIYLKNNSISIYNDLVNGDD